MTSPPKEDLAAWFGTGVEQGATHLLVLMDTFDGGCWPVYVRPGEAAAVRIRELNCADAPMTRVMECYVLEPSRQEAQLQEPRAWYPKEFPGPYPPQGMPR